MANNFFNKFDKAGQHSQCADHHIAEKALFKTKAAFRDAVDCGMDIQCTRCGMRAAEIPELQFAVFGLPPEWFVRVFKNGSRELVIIEKERGK